MSSLQSLDGFSQLSQRQVQHAMSAVPRAMRNTPEWLGATPAGFSRTKQGDEQGYYCVLMRKEGFPDEWKIFFY